MKFRFSLATVLRIRQGLEEREERVLGKITHQLEQNARKIQEVVEETATTALRNEQLLQTAQPAQEIHMAYAALEELKMRKQGLERRHLELEALRLKQVGIYQMAHRDRKMLSDLRDERREVHDADEARREQMDADDSFNARRHR